MAGLLASTGPAASMPTPLRAPSPVLVDVAIAAAALAGSLLLLGHGGLRPEPSASELDALGVVLAVATCLPLLGWRRAPFGVFVTVAAVSTATAGLGYYLGVPLPTVAALYLLAVSRDETRPWTRRTVGTAVAAGVAFLAATAAAAGGFPLADLVHSGLPWAVAWFAGERTRLRRAHVADLEERVARAGRDAERDRRLAVAEERARIARDLHDSAGHAINVIAIRAGAARLRHDAERSPIALQAIEDLARRTAGEIDRLVGSLRDRDAGVEAPAGLASLDTLVAQHAAAGLAVDVARTGTPRPLPAAVDQAGYRIVQEALTNAARHGTGPACVDLAYGDTALALTVSNPAPAVTRTRGGHGLIGMRERAGLLGGTLCAGPVGGEFRVHAELPYLS